MRLLRCSQLELHFFTDGDVPLHAILSHTWAGEEVSYQDIVGEHGVCQKKQWAKIQRSCEVAASRGLDYVCSILPLLCGEGATKAFRRTQYEIIRSTDDEYIYA